MKLFYWILRLKKAQNTLERNLYPIEEAWLHEGIKYIYEKSGDFETATEHYEKALEKYELANTEEYHDSSETHYIDGDWNCYCIKSFYFQPPEALMLNLTVEHFMKFNFGKIKYRILNLEEKMK